MAFRAADAAQTGYDEVENYLIKRTRNADEAERNRSKIALRDIVDELGPVVDAYPSWHPLVSNHDGRHPTRTPGTECGYNGLDHTRYFVNGFITCPYGNGQNVIDSVNSLPFHPAAAITAERLDVQFYTADATPILVKCEWKKPIQEGGMIPLSIAAPLILEKEVPGYEWAQVAETWETMRPYLLGAPYGSRSSLFVSQETGQSIKKLWEMLIHTGMFGPIRI
ncbi:hypothetical protein [Janthinobacterium sp. NKUCC06_STL]|uniref:hypothetical protein n=1 Tax=Janthinobacterium sp. NKUCC06_STL TaxID=2842127 RepID=UPI001C5A9BA2|nr:hypothetical protein [Janthinobacterium sp. NKUCC06_STL]MBW3513088.1 hypothetical protein [Janthinobacterium sp. NKUCC06_STL]